MLLKKFAANCRKFSIGNRNRKKRKNTGFFTHHGENFNKVSYEIENKFKLGAAKSFNTIFFHHFFSGVGKL